MSAQQVLLTGATGFVGRALQPLLAARGIKTRCLTRDVAKARARAPKLDWVEGNVDDASALDSALAGCDTAYYLVHAMGDGNADFVAREMAAAKTFAAAAARANVQRVVYLGGIAPARIRSEHLRSRLQVGEILRAGEVPTIELRASMIVGYGSQSWLIVRDLAARLPVMLLPRWLESKTQPIAIDDVTTALIGALDLPADTNAAFDIPGPRVMSGAQILDETAIALGFHRPAVLRVPVLSPWLSSHWVRLVTRARWSIAKELVAGLQEDVLARDAKYWPLIHHPALVDFRDAARKAIAAERHHAPIVGPWAAVEKLRTAS